MPRFFQVGVARRSINPLAGVELAGLGYYLNRTWLRVRDHLTATALVIGDGKTSIAIVALDLMYNDASFTRNIRRQVAAKTDLRPEAICINCSHTHNAPTAGLILGAGERHALYLEFAAAQAAAAVIEAWQQKQAAKLSVGHGDLPGMTFNRTRDEGPVDSRVSVLRADAADGRPLALALNFHSHCIAHMETDLRALSRDWPGEVVDGLEAAFPGALALYLQGTCGDTNFRREFNGTERRFEPARAILDLGKQAIKTARTIDPAAGLAVASHAVHLPTRRWTRDEITRDREEGLYRLRTGDTTGWMDGIARVCVNQPERLSLRYGGDVGKAVAAVARFAVEWTDLALPKLQTRPETLETEVQAMRIGDVYLAANPSELFTSLGLELRERWQSDDLFMLGYSNGSIGYLPDAHDIERRSYAAIQSPKFTGQSPFVRESGHQMVQGMLAAMKEVELNG